jgi:molybdopterin-guanine dinucleotide biosynthesis protein MobB
MNPAIFGIYGKSKTGKTSLIVDIINQLSKEGFKIASIKISDKKIDIDTKGKDSWKHADAGARLVVLSSKYETDFLLKQKVGIQKILNQIKSIDNFDLILVEGANDKSIPKIKIGDIENRENTILTYTGDFKNLIDMMKKEILRRKNMENISIKVNGKEIFLTDFPTEIIINTICGMLKSLKGVDEIKDVDIKFKL